MVHKTDYKKVEERALKKAKEPKTRKASKAKAIKHSDDSVSYEGKGSRPAIGKGKGKLKADPDKKYPFKGGKFKEGLKKAAKKQMAKDKDKRSIGESVSAEKGMRKFAKKRQSEVDKKRRIKGKIKRGEIKPSKKPKY